MLTVRTAEKLAAMQRNLPLQSSGNWKWDEGPKKGSFESEERTVF